MNDASAAREPEHVPTFMECVVGYRAWHADVDGQLWPLHAASLPWLPGINTARCSCGSWRRLRFEWFWQQGRRVLAPAPEHPAPDPKCECGLYSWRRPRRAWYRPPTSDAPLLVVGAVASWGHLQVHKDGFRAEHACVVTLAYHPDTRADALEALSRIATRYRADLVPLDDLEQAASRHGTPLPDTLSPAASPSTSEEESDPHIEIQPAPDATIEEVGNAPPRIGFDGKPLPKPGFEHAGFGYVR
jgi:hypothetical protein